MAERLRARLASAAVMVTVACALVTTGLIVRRELVAGDAPRRAPKRVSESEWQELTASGQRSGSGDAPLTIVVFADFQCPACREFALGPLAQIRSEFAGQVSVVFRHWPLPYHPRANATAVAAECAAAQGAFQEFHDLVFLKQDSLSSKPLLSYAVAAGVRDTLAFGECLTSAEPTRAIARDVAAASAIGAVGTPTVIANGRQYLGFPTAAQLAELVSSGS